VVLLLMLYSGLFCEVNITGCNMHKKGGLPYCSKQEKRGRASSIRRGLKRNGFDSYILCLSNQLCNRVSVELRHDLTELNFNGLFRNAQFESNLVVEHTGDICAKSSNSRGVSSSMQ
jgi:hypothetical protein